MWAFVDQLEDSHKPFTITNHKIIWSWIETNSSQLHFSRTSVTLLSLETEGLIKALGNIDVREGPSITVVPPDVNRKVMWASHELLIHDCTLTRCLTKGHLSRKHSIQGKIVEISKPASSWNQVDWGSWNNPLHSRNFFEMATGESKHCLSRVHDCPINYDEAAILISYPQESQIHSRGNLRDRWSNFIKWESLSVDCVLCGGV